MTKNELIDLIIKNKYTNVVSYKDVWAMVEEGCSDIKDEIVALYQFRDRDTFEILEVQENFKDYVFNNFVGALISRSCIIDDFNRYVSRPLNMNCMSDIRPLLQRSLKSKVEGYWNDYQKRVQEVTPEKIRELANEILSHKAEFLEKIKESPAVVYVRDNRPNFDAVLWQFTDNKFYGSRWLDLPSDKTPDDYRKELEAKRRETNAISAYYDRIGHCDC